MSKEHKTISIIGAGNAAHALASNLNHSNFKIHQVLARNFGEASNLAEKVNCKYITGFSDLEYADIFLILTSDSAILEVASNIKHANSLIVHSSGATELDVLKSFKNRGVLYPLQTLSKERDTDLSKVPFFIEGSNQESVSILIELANCYTSIVKEVNSSKRLKIHLAGVIANNFSNYMFTVAFDILKKSGLNQEHLLPLIKETALKVQHMAPKDAQTGPAIRNDTPTIQKHLKVLAELGEYEKLYSFVSESIKK